MVTYARARPLTISGKVSETEKDSKEREYVMPIVDISDPKELDFDLVDQEYDHRKKP